MKLLKPILSAAVIVAAFASANAQWVISDHNSAATQDFDSIGTSATASLPTGWKVAGGATPNYSTGTSAATQAAGTSGGGALTGSSGGGTYNFANGVTASATDRAVGFLNSGSFTSPRSLMVEVQNGTGASEAGLKVSYDIEKYRSGTRAFDVSFFYSTDGTSWTEVSGVKYSFGTEANNTTVSNPPLTSSISEFYIASTVASASSIYLRWDVTGVGGSTNGKGLGFDNIKVTLVPEPSTYAMFAGLGLMGFGVYRRLRR